MFPNSLAVLEVSRPFWVTIGGPTADEQRARRIWTAAVEAASLAEWLQPWWVPGPLWELRFEGHVIWTGTTPSVEAWTDALLEAWWGAGGHGCC